jgi:hypothetical protein
LFYGHRRISADHHLIIRTKQKLGAAIRVNETTSAAETTRGSPLQYLDIWLKYLQPYSKPAFLLFIAVVSFSGLAVADTHDVDRLTEHWLNTEAQVRQIERDWRREKPILEQRTALLQAEKTQLETILSESKHSRGDVELRRAELLKEQAYLEKEQAELDNALTLVMTRIEAIEGSLPPMLVKAWQDEHSALGVEPEANLQLQVALAKLSRLAEFTNRISVNETRMQSPQGSDIVAKQLFLGTGMAWFTNDDGSFSGWGKASQDGWQWQIDSEINSAEIHRAIAIFEKRRPAELVRLPLHIDTKTQ